MKTKVNQKKDQQVNRVNTTENTGKVSGLPSSNSVQQQQADVIENSSLLTLQKKKLDNLFGATAQREVKPEEEELLQPKMVAQREVKPEEEEKLLQPKMVAQREPANEAAESSTDDKTVSGNFHAKISSDDAEELLQQKAIQRKAPEEEELLQGKFRSQPIKQMKLEEEEKLPSQAKAITQRVENKTGMPDNLKTGVEQLSGLDMSDVKVHYNSAKPASVQAHAYTQGSDIHVAPGQEQHLGHEAWHVAQQKQGRVQPTIEVAGMPVNDNPNLETEADIMGGKASRL